MLVVFLKSSDMGKKKLKTTCIIIVNSYLITNHTSASLRNFFIAISYYFFFQDKSNFGTPKIVFHLGGNKGACAICVFILD